MNEDNFFFLFMLLTVVTITAIYIYLQKPKVIQATRGVSQQQMYQ